jgi:hypothetical protein
LVDSILPEEKPEDMVSPRRSRLYSRQWLIAKKALSFLFDGRITPVRTHGRISQVKFGPGAWRLERLQQVFSLLEENTGPGLIIDPLKITDETAWVIVSQVLSVEGLKSVALALAYRYLDVYYQLQADLSKRMYKAQPLFWLSKLLRDLGEAPLARGCMLLAYLEDLFVDRDPTASRAYGSLLQLFAVPQATLDSLAKFAGESEERVLFPEEILIQWELDNAPSLSLLYPRR